MRASLALFVLVLATLMGCDKVRTVPPRDAGPVCEDNEQLVNGQCRFVCNRDGDCAVGQRCNLLLGSCEPKPPPVDAGPMITPCTEGAVRCAADNGSVERCNATGGWVVAEQCVQPEGFCQNEQCLRCRPGASRCAGGGTQIEICLDDGSDFRQVTCAAGATCVAGECAQCTIGQKRCSANGQSLEECQRLPREDLSAGYVPSGDNFDGTCVTQVCEQGPNGPQCRAPACLPGSTRCLNAATQQVCSATGAYTDVACASLPGMGPTAECLSGVCIDECAEAVRANSYFGCEYWSTVLDNSVDRLFKGGAVTGQGTADSDFVFVVTNQSAVAANVEVWRYQGSAPVRVKSVTVPGRTDPVTKGLVKIPVPWQSITPSNQIVGLADTGRQRWAYRLTSNRPVTVYQFSPIDALKVTNRTCTAANNTRDCSCNEYSDFDSLGCFLGDFSTAGVCTQTTNGKRCQYGSFSNDASLLLPAHILGTSYVTLTPEHVHLHLTGSGGGEFPYSSTYSVVATQDNTSVTIRSSGVTKASVTGTSVPAFAVGETRTIVLNSYEVLQLASATAGTDIQCITAGGDSKCRKSNDLTGSIVTSDKPIAIFSANPCLQVPYDRVACDHVEEQLFPFSTWGRNFVAQPSHPLRLNNNQFATNPPPDYFKIVAGASATLTITPPPTAADVVAPTNCTTGSLTTNNCALAGGAFVLFKSTRAFTVSATNPIAVAQFFSGQGNTTGAPTDPQQGDPSMVLLPPIEQWRSRYTVLASTGYKDNYLGLTIDSGKVQTVRVDGATVTGFTTIPGTPFQGVNWPVTTGTHTIEVIPQANQQTLPGAGVTVHGYDAYVSYGYTGGLDLTTIVTGVTPGG
ncbi:MAG: IgGFc-binding protein [Archangium sp.]